jgi:hypothetical protein
MWTSVAGAGRGSRGEESVGMAAPGVVVEVTDMAITAATRERA